MYAFEGLRDHGANAKQPRPLRSPVARAARPVLLSREYDQRRALGLVLDRRVVDTHLLAARLMNRDTAFGAGNHQVLDPNIRKRSSSHHAIVAATRTV